MNPSRPTFAHAATSHAAKRSANHATKAQYGAKQEEVGRLAEQVASLHTANAAAVASIEELTGSLQKVRTVPYTRGLSGLGAQGSTFRRRADAAVAVHQATRLHSPQWVRTSVDSITRRHRSLLFFYCACPSQLLHWSVCIAPFARRRLMAAA